MTAQLEQNIFLVKSRIQNNYLIKKDFSKPSMILKELHNDTLNDEVINVFYFNYFENLSINKKITQSKSGVSKLSMVLKALNNNTYPT